MRRLMVLTTCMVIAGATTAFAQPAPGGAERYSVTEIEGGIVRVDRYTGEVSVCRDRGDGWYCELAHDDRAGHRQPSYGGSYDDLDRRGSDRYRQRERDELELGDGIVTREEVDQAMDSFEYMMERLMGAAERLSAPPPPEDEQQF